MRMPPVRHALPLLALFSLLAVSGCGSSSTPVTSTPGAAAAGGDITAPTTFPVAFEAGVSDPSPGWGQPVYVEGRVTGVEGETTALLQFRTPHTSWRTVDSGPVSADGGYSFRLAAHGSGMLRVALARPGSTTVADEQHTSPPQPVNVRATVTMGTRKLQPVKGKPAVIAGRVGPGDVPRAVVAEAYRGGRWQQVAATTSSPDGGAYRLTWTPKGSPWVRVVAKPDRIAGGTSRLAGYTGTAATSTSPDGQLATSMTATGPMRVAVASRFDDYNLPVACGGTLGVHEQGVAHKTLPCGTIVTITYNGRTVRVPVVDRGPYIAGREFDLTGATANTLGFEGVHKILVSP
jgi:hypothetical protein